MANNQQNIYLSYERDLVIIVWLNKMKAMNKKRSSYIKHALRCYIKEKRFTCIAKIHMSNSDIEKFSEVSILGFYLDKRSNDIRNWWENLERENLSAKEFVIEILRNSIQIVPESEEEWFAGVLDLNKISNVNPNIDFNNTNIASIKQKDLSLTPSDEQGKECMGLENQDSKSIPQIKLSSGSIETDTRSVVRSQEHNKTSSQSSVPNLRSMRGTSYMK